MITISNVTWAHVLLLRPPTVRSTPSVEREGCDHGTNREASSFGGDTESGDDESESIGKGLEMVTSEADDNSGRDNTPLVLERAVSTTSRVGNRYKAGSFGEGLADALATSNSFSRGSDQLFAALRAGEARETC